MKVSKTRRLKLLRDMEASREIHQRGYLTFSERMVVEAIVLAIEESRPPVEQAVEPEYDPPSIVFTSLHPVPIVCTSNLLYIPTPTPVLSVLYPA